MSVRAKFKVQSVAKTAGWGAVTEFINVRLVPVTSGSTENQQFYATMPGGSINLSVVPPAIGSQFSVDQEFYVDFTAA